MRAIGRWIASYVVVLVGCTAPVDSGDGPVSRSSSASKQQQNQSNQQPHGPKNVFVPAQFQTVQSAVEAVADGGTVHIAPGTYFENVVIAGKHVRLRGSGPLGQTIISGVNQGPVISFLPNSGGGVRDLVVRNGSLGVFGHAEQGLAPDRVSLRHVAVEGFTWAVAGSFDHLDIHDANITGHHGNGIGVAAVRALSIRDSTVSGFPGMGVLVDNVPGKDCGTDIKRSVFDDNALGGIRINGHGCPVFIDRVSATGNGDAGIDLHQTGTALIHETEVAATSELAGKWGDGLRIVSSPVTATFLFSHDNARMGVSLFGCSDSGKPASLVLVDSTIGCNPNSIDVEHGDLTLDPPVVCSSGYSLDTSSGNVCSVEPECTPGPCHPVSSSLEPPPLPPERPG